MFRGGTKIPGAFPKPVGSPSSQGPRKISSGFNDRLPKCRF